MKISKSEFKEELNNPKKRNYSIVFLGMSGSGKTYWSKKLSKKYDYKHIEFDELIGKSKEIANLINDIPGKDEAEKMGNYFGKPWEKGFQSRESSYLSIERKCMSDKFPIGTILDLTGSAIYHPKQMEEIAKNSLVLYLKANLKAQKEMLRIYLSGPKPVCWNGMFKKKNQESNEEALARCYPLLLRHRSKLYEKYADVRIPYDAHKNIKGICQFVEEISKRLK